MTVTAAQGFAVAMGYTPAPAPVATPPKPRGPWCSSCGHEYRTRAGAPEIAGLFPMAECPYCRTYSAPVQTKPFHEVSKSEIEKFSTELGPDKGCKRRWFYVKLCGFDEPKNPYAELGILGHSKAEDWLIRRTLPVINSMAPKNDPHTLVGLALLGGIPHAPPPDAPGLAVEREFHIEFEGVRYMGYKDFSASTSEKWPGAPSTPMPAVGDWKFTSDLKWAPTPEALAVDVQAIIYGWDEIERWRADSAWLSWVYMQRGTRNARPVRTLVHREGLREGMRRLNVISREMLAYRERFARGELTDRDVPGNARACKAFGKTCPHVDRCPITAEERLAAAMQGTAFDEILRATAAPSATPAFVPPVGVLPPPAPVAPPAPPPVVAPPPAPAAPTLVKMLFPDGKVYDVQSDQVAHYTANSGATIAPPAAPPAPPPAPAPVAQAAQHQGPGRPPGTRKPRAAAAPKVVAQSAPSAAPAPAPAPTSIVDAVGVAVGEAPAPVPSLGFTLLVNTSIDPLPEGARIVRASDVIAVVAKDLCNDQQVKYYGGIANGMGPYLLCQYLEGMAKDGMLGLDADTIVDLDMHTLEGRDTLATFERLAGVVFRSKS